MSSTETATFAIELKDEVSRSAHGAADSLEALEAKIMSGQKRLGAMEAAMRKLKAGGKGASDAATDLRDKIAAQRTALASTQEAYIKLGGTFAKASPVAITGAFAGLTDKLKGLPGPLGSMGSGLAALGGPAGMAVAAIGAVVGVLVALSAALVTATAALLRYGVAQADVRRNEALRLEGLTTLRRWYGLAAGSATEMQEAIDRVSDATGAGRGELEQYTQRLYRMGLRGEQLSQALEGVQVAAAVQGERGAARFMGLAAGIARTGGEVRRLTEDYQARLGPIARRQMLGLDAQTRRLHQSLERLFSGLRIEGFLTGLQGILTLFSQTTVTGRALKSIVESLFQPLIDFAAGPVATLIKRFFQGMVLGLLYVERAVLRLRILFRETFGDSNLFGDVDTEMLVFKAGAALLVVGLAVLVGAVAAVATGVVVMGAALAAAAAPMILLIELGRRFVTWWGAQDWTSLGRSIVDGIVNGIRSGIATVRSTMQGLATTARSAITSALDIHSPSRVFADLGRQIPAGLTLGIEAGTPAAEGAAAAMVSAPELGAVRGGGGASITIGEIHIHAESSDPNALARGFVDQLAELLEGAGITMGAPA